MGLYNRKDSPYIWGVSYKHGLRPFSTETDDKKLAEKILAKKVGEALSYEHGFTQSTLTLKELLNHWVKYATRNKADHIQDAYQCGILLDFFSPTKQAAKITTEDIEKFREYRQGQGVAVSTINRNCALLRAAYNLAFREGRLKHNPMRNIRFYNEASRARTRFLTENERERLLQSCGEKIKPLVILALNTGMREGELLNLRWENIDLGSKRLRVVKSKSGKPRSIPLNSEALLTLNQLANHTAQTTGSEYVFPTTKETRRPWYGYRGAWERAVRDSGIGDLNFHDLRHDFASRLVSSGEDLYVVATLLGHSSLKMTQRYAHLAPEGLRKAVERLENHYDPATQQNEKNLKIV